MTEVSEQYGNFLKAKREQSGLSQRDVANLLNYSTPQFISNWERGISYPPATAINKLASAFKINAEELFDPMLKAILEQTENNLRRKYQNTRKKNKVA
ncbi:MAG: helix-turn-helix domain-containing protein [Pseudobdellovibrionaceae bacterium]